MNDRSIARERPARKRIGSDYPPADLPIPVTEQLGRAVTRHVLRRFFGADHLDTHHIPKTGPVILVSNHPTMSDPFIVAFGTKRWVTWLAFEDALAWPGFGDIMRLYRVIPLKIEKPRPSQIKAAYATLAQDRVLGLFFEGERSFTDGLNRPLKPGAARIAIKAGATLVPVTVSGARRCWARQWSWPRPGRIVVRYHPPIDAQRWRPELPLRERARLLTEELGRIIGDALPPGGAPRFYGSTGRRSTGDPGRGGR